MNDVAEISLFRGGQFRWRHYWVWGHVL